jgi:hypothetical protein
VENVVKKKRKRNITVTVVKNAKIKRRMRSNAHLKKKSVENALSYKLPNFELKTKKVHVCFCLTTLYLLTAFVVTNHYFLEKRNDL